MRPVIGAAVGIDACRGGWVVVALRSGRSPTAHVVAEIAAVAAAVPDAGAIAIDIPIGLPAASARRADLLAARMIGARRSSVFPTPVRLALEAPTHAEAVAISRQRAGFGISRQAFALRDRIFEVEKWLPDAPCGVWEAHPELCFTALMGRPAEFTKRSPPGAAERRAALEAAGIGMRGIDHVAPLHDVFDAAVVAWTAQRLIAGEAISVPDPPETFDGRPVAIWV